MKIYFLDVIGILVLQISYYYCLPSITDICQYGCNNCLQVNQQNTCSVCQDGYFLDPISGFCKYDKCDRNLVFTSPNQNKQCVAICEPNYIADYGIKQCIIFEECQKFYISKSTTSQKIQIRNIFIYSEDFLLVLYDSYFNIVDRNTGIIEQSISYQNGTVKFQLFSDIPFLMLSNQSIIKWDFIVNSGEVISNILNGVLSQDSEILSIDNLIICVTSFSLDKKYLYITPILQVQSDILLKIKQEINSLIVETSQINIKFLKNKFLVELQEKSIKISKLIVQSKEIYKLQFEPLSNFINCDDMNQIHGYNYAIDIDQDDQSLMVIINQLPLFITVDIQKQNCQIQQLNNNPIKFKIHKVNNQPSFYYLIIQFQNSFQIYEQNFKLFQNINFQNNIIQMIGFNIQNSLNKLYILLDNKQINFYTFDINTLDFNYIGNKQIQIEEPKFFKVDNYSKFNKNQPFNTLFVYNFDCQAFNQLTDETIYILSSLQMSYNSHKSSITSIATNQSQQFVVSASKDGNIIIWQIQNKYEGHSIFSFNSITEQCFSVIIFNERVIIARYQTKFLTININNPYLQNIITLSQGKQTRGVLILKDSFMLVQGQCAAFYNTQLLRQFIYCEETISMTQNLKFTNDNLILIQTEFKIFLYKVNQKDQSLQQMYSYLSDTSITLFIMRVFTNNTYVIALIDSKNKIIQLNSQLIKTNQYNLETIKYPLDLKYPINSDEDIYCLLAINIDTSVLNKYQIYKINFRQNPIVELWQSIQIGSEISIFYISQDTIGNYFYNVIVMMAQPSQQIFGTIRINKSTNEIHSGPSIYSPLQKLSTQITPNSLGVTSQYSGFESGQVLYSAHHKRVYKIVFQSTSGIINKVYQSIRLQTYYIITQQVQIFNINTDQLSEIITFEDKDQEINLITSDSLRISIFFQRNEISLKNHKSDQTLKMKDLGLIRGVYIDDARSRIYIYGSKLSSFSINLNSEQIIISLNIIQCVFSTNVAFCKIDNQELHAYSLIGYSLLFQIKPQGLSEDYKLDIDLNYQYLYLYYQAVQIYTFSGDFVTILTQPSKPLISIKPYGTKVVAYTNGNLYIYSRDKLDYLTMQMSPSEGNIIWIKYYEQVDQLIFASDLFGNGQIFLYSLTKLSDPIGISNSVYSQKEQAVGYYYHPYMQFGIFVDRLGQAQAINYQAAYGNGNILSLKQYFKGDYLVHFLLNSNTNKIFMGNSQNLYSVDLNSLFKQPQQLFQEKVKKHVLITYNSQNILFLIDKQNYLYKYSNYKIRFITFFKKPVLDIQLVGSSSLIVIALQETLYTYDLNTLINLTFHSISPQSEIKGFLYKEYLGKEIFQTYDQNVIHYDFKQNKTISQFKFENEDDFITKSYWIQSNSILLLGMNTGYILIYNTNTQQLQKIIQKNLIMPIKSFIEFSSSLILAFLKNGSFIQIKDFLNQYNIKITQLKYILPNDTLLEDELEFCNAVYDEKFNRIYSWVVHQQTLHVLDSISFKITIQISFPSNQINKLKVGENSLVLYSQFQIHVYLRSSFEFLFSIRKASRYDKITNLILLQDKSLVVSYLQKLEVYLIDLNAKTFQLIDTITTNFPIISFSEYIIDNRLNSSYILHIIGFSLTNIFEKSYNLNLLNQKQNQCSSYLDANSIFRLKSEYEINYQPNSNITYTFFLKINSTLESIKILDQQSSQLIINSLSGNNDEIGILNLNIKSFLYIKKDLILKNFQFNFIEPGIYQTSEESKNIIFENIVIDSNNIQEISFKFQNKKQIIFKKLVIQSSNSKRMLLGEKGSEELYKNSLFQILNTESVSIYDLVIENANITSRREIFFFQNIKFLCVKRLTIINSTINMIFDIHQTQELELLDFLITGNQNFQNQINEQYQMYYLFEIEGSQSTTIKNLTMSNNKDILFFQTTNIFFNDNKIIILTDDAFSMSNIIIKNNLFSHIKNFLEQSINYGLQQIQSMILLQNYLINLFNITIIENQSNIKIEEASNVILKKCTFIKNTSQKGGGIYLKSITQEIQIINSTFSQNKAFEDGGGIYISNINNIILSDNSRILENQALIGGGIRFINIQQRQLNISVDSFVQNNYAEVYGNNIANYPTKIKVNIDYENNNLKYILNSQTTQDEYQAQQIYEIKNYKSGGQMNITVQFVDDDNNVLQISGYKILNNRYPKSIIEDIKKMSFSFSSNQQVFLSDEGIVNYKYYDQNYFGFFKKDMIVSALPNENKVMLFNYQFNGEESLKSIKLNVSFRGCQVGEIEKEISSTNILCQECPQDFYSLYEFKNHIHNHQIEDDVQCIKCPDSAIQCQKNIIQVKNGYWRKNNQTDEILQCENNSEACIPENENNIFGCLEGHIGPLCEVCDLSGKVWKGKKFSQSINKWQCQECSPIKLQLIYILIVMISFLIYLFWVFLIFVTSQYKAQICYYMRKMSIIPFSVTQYNDKSNFFLKILVNHFQITYLLKLQIQFIPEIIKHIPSFLGSAVSQIAINILCMFTNEQINTYSKGKLEQIIQLMIFILITFILLVALIIFKYFKLKNIKNHSIYTLINFLYIIFQIDSLNLYAKQLRCRQIGSYTFIQSDLLYSCDDESYQLFIKYFTIPILVFWVVYPIFPFIFLYRNKTKLSYCLVKFKFGYYYSEFSEQFYYWEFIRIYLKVFIVFICTFLLELQILNSLFLNLIIFLYIILVIKNEPFFSKKLMQLEIQSYINIAFLVIIQTLIKYNKHFALEILNFICYYTFVLYLASEILIEVIKKSQNQLGKTLRWLMIAILGKNKFQSKFNYNIQDNGLKSILRWKKIYQNINFLTQYKAINIIKDISQQQLVRRIKSIDKQNQLYQSYLSLQIPKLDVDESSSKFKETKNSSLVQEQRENQFQESYINDHNSSPLFKTQKSIRSQKIIENVLSPNADLKESQFSFLKKQDQQFMKKDNDLTLENIHNQNNIQILSFESINTEDHTKDTKQHLESLTSVKNVKSNNFQTFIQKGQNSIKKSN